MALLLTDADTRSPEQEVIYHIIDQPPPAQDSTWYRVAAIVVTGAGWQFKDYPFEVLLSRHCATAGAWLQHSCRPACRACRSVHAVAGQCLQDGSAA